MNIAGGGREIVLLLFTACEKCNFLIIEEIIFQRSIDCEKMFIFVCAKIGNARSETFK